MTAWLFACRQTADGPRARLIQVGHIRGEPIGAGRLRSYTEKCTLTLVRINGTTRTDQPRIVNFASLRFEALPAASLARTRAR